MTPPKTTPVFLLRLILLVAAIAAGVWGMVTGHPFKALSADQQTVLGVFRLAYGLLFGLRVLRSFPAAPLIMGWQQTNETRRWFSVWLVICLCMAAGFLTPLALLGHWFLQVTVQRKNRVYSVEDVLHRAPGFGLLFMNSHLVFSVDSWLGWDFGLNFSSAPGVNFFAWCFGMIMFSTGFEKVWSPVWQKGLGYYHFISLSFITRPFFRHIRRVKLLVMAMGWFALVLELSYIFLIPFPTLMGLGSALIVVFGVTLGLGTTNFFFIGAVTMLNGAVLAALGLLPQVATAEYVLPWQLWVLPVLYSLGMVAMFNFVPIRDNWIAWLMDRTMHLRPYILFNEVHFYGLYIYRVIAHTPAGRVDCIKAFEESGEPGPMQVFRPVTIYASYSRLSDYCIAVIHNQPDRMAYFGRLIPDLGHIALERLDPQSRATMTQLTMEVRVYDPDTEYNITESPWKTGWVPIGHFDLSNDNILWVQEGEVPHYGKTVRWPVLWN